MENYEDESIRQNNMFVVMAWEVGLQLGIFLQAMRAVLGEL